MENAPRAGEKVELEIEDLAFGGKGVGRAGGLAVFVPWVIPGERVRVRVTRRKRKFAEAELVEVMRASPDRVVPWCRYFGECGGCAYQHIRYEQQLELKAKQVEQTLRRLGRLDAAPTMRPAVASTREYGYRNRIRVHADAEGRVGFYRMDAHELVDVAECPIAAPEVNDELERLRSGLLREGDYVLTGERREYFVQTNDAVAAALLELTGRLAGPGMKVLVDAYCGAGFFGRGLEGRFERVIGIEENERAVEYARRLAGPKESYVAGDVGIRLGQVLADVPRAETCVILDPPAAGAEWRVLEYLLGGEPAEVLYVSCNPGTLARDLEILCRAYRLESVTPLDMFPQTAEIETVTHLVLKHAR